MALAFPPDLPVAGQPKRLKTKPGGYRLDNRHPGARGWLWLYLLTEGAGATAYDLAGLRQNGAINCGWQGTDYGQSAQFTSNTYIATPQLSNQPAVGFSYVCLFRTTGANQAQTLIRSTGPASGNLDVGLTVNHTGLSGGNANRFAVHGYNQGSGSFFSTFSFTNCNDGAWHLGVGTYDGSTLTVYVDGTLEATNTYSGIANQANLIWYIGRYPGANADFLTGNIAMVGMLSRIVTPSEVMRLYLDTRRGGLPHWIASPTDAAYTAALASGQEFARALVETLALADSRRVAALKGLLEGLTLSDAAVQAIRNAAGQALTKLLTEPLPLSDARASALGKQIVDALTLTDARALSLLRHLAEQVGLADSFNALIGAAALYFFVDVLQSGHQDTQPAQTDPTLDDLSGGRA